MDNWGNNVDKYNTNANLNDIPNVSQNTNVITQNQGRFNKKPLQNAQEANANFSDYENDNNNNVNQFNMKTYQKQPNNKLNENNTKEYHNEGLEGKELEEEDITDNNNQMINSAYLQNSNSNNEDQYE